jgi:hypothetical protein
VRDRDFRMRSGLRLNESPDMWRPGPVTTILKRYEIVIVAIAAIVVIVRLAGGTFVATPDTAGPIVTPNVVTEAAPFAGVASEALWASEMTRWTDWQT